MRLRLAAMWLAVQVVVITPLHATAQDGAAGGDPSPGALRWRGRPSIQLGPHLRLDLRLKLARDVVADDSDSLETSGTWRLRRAGLDGRLGRDVRFQLEHDLHRDGEWRDAYVGWSRFEHSAVRGGRFKVPFGREQLTSVADLDFAHRTLASATIAPGRATGVMVDGRWRRYDYAIGIFRHDGDNGRLREAQFVPEGEVARFGPSYAGRVRGAPLSPLGDRFRALRLGLAYGQTRVPEGLNSLRGRTLVGERVFFSPMYVNGTRARLGAEVSYTAGPAGVAAEWMQASEQRRRQGIGDVDLSDLVTTGWYASGTWMLTGEKKASFDGPRRPLFAGGWGAFELAGRIDALGFQTASQAGLAMTNPRAERVLPHRARAVTLGVNWFVNRWVRLTMNALRETLTVPAPAAASGHSHHWAGVGRLQLVF